MSEWRRETGRENKIRPQPGEHLFEMLNVYMFFVLIIFVELDIIQIQSQSLMASNKKCFTIKKH